MAILGAALAITAGVGAAPASAANTDSTASPKADCGWRTDWLGNAYWNNCTGKKELVWVDRLNVGGIQDHEKCLPAGDNYMGNWPDIQGVQSKHKSC
ncbi:hypothetical protein NLX83_12380 [Allokutzneria sp. A3M-2-11 16]|uniref:DUF6355 family natural product biosynthesis protein n=1 Tax=Allokutzneria sp. A3M-2-11 16 TaxID=2962043 RepID=UPI0020B71333|nr:hypothetical protein [Allokutzneria sp. A3M-2-11 16]MCP3800054.1 hypothetical protein [Allokutzneria sp. A3M-2-11 16]